jgi:hypothetical protein
MAQKIEPDTLSHWINKIGFDISEIVFVNWNAGGTSSISGLLKDRIYSKDNYNWTNELIVRYGLNKQDGIELRKTEDVQFNSALGYRKTHSLTGTTPQNSISIPNSDGYAYPKQKFPYLNALPRLYFLGLGAGQKTKKNYFIYPFHFKITMVLDQRLANQGALVLKKSTI